MKKAFQDRDKIASIYKRKYPDIEKFIDENKNYYYVCGGVYSDDDEVYDSIVISIDDDDSVCLTISYYFTKIINENDENI